MWLPSGSSVAAQINMWFMLPTLVLLLTYVKDIKKLIQSKEEILVILFIVWFIISGLWSTSEKSSQFSNYIKHGSYVLVYLSGLNSIYLKNPKYLLRSIDAAMLAVAIGALITLYLQVYLVENSLVYRNIRINEMGIGEFGKFSGALQSANYFGAFTVLAFSRFIASKTHYERIIFLTFTAIFGTYVFFTGSRSPLAGVLFGFIASLAILRPKLTLPAFLVSVPCIAFLIYLSTDVSSITFSPETFDQVMASITSNRWFVWEKATSLVLNEHPLVGFGANAAMAFFNPLIDFTYYHPHSGFVLIVYETGLIGLTLYLLAMGSLLFYAFKHPNKELVQIAVGLLAFCFIAMLTDVHKIVTRPHGYWVFLWLPVGIILASKRTAIPNSDRFQSSRTVVSETAYPIRQSIPKKKVSITTSED